MTEFEREVTESLAMLEERTRDLPQLKNDVADIRGRVKLLEFKSGMFGIIGAGLVVGGKELITRLVGK